MLNGVQKYGKKLKIKQRRAKFYEFILITPGFMVVSSAIFTGLPRYLSIEDKILRRETFTKPTSFLPSSCQCLGRIFPANAYDLTLGLAFY